MSSEIWQLKLTARHILENLATDLYKDPGDCLAELIRNGLCACMPEGKWVPKLGHVEIFLVDNHPLGPKSKSLVILDHGSGFTQPAIRLYCTIGPAIGDPGSGHSGAAQKRIGRFSGPGLNQKSVDGDISTGFYILTRTATEGPVVMVSMIPEKIELQNGAIVAETISETSAELGPQKGIKGSFTAIVVPNSVFHNYDQIREALMWRVPRKRDLMYRLEVGGKQIVAPPLADKVVITQEDGPIETYLDRLDDRDDLNGGIWFTDANTGLRVASARVLGPQRLPYPLWKPDLIGDIFGRDFLANQDTARASFSSRYLSSAAWRRLTTYLVGQVVPKAKSLLGDDDVIGRDPASKSLISFIERCNHVWGKPDSNGGCGGILFEDGPRVRSRNGSGTHTTNPEGKGTRGPQLNPNTNGKPRVVQVRIGDRTFVLNKRPMDPRIYAEVDIANGQVIHISDGGYIAMPTTREARDEHVILKVLEAAGQAIYSDNPNEVRCFVAERRKDFLKSK
ncbi:MAG: hypothetical protein KW788_01420 [Candidatus Doudnabacteria bacterium]|nr:hypothetical protein [Candidatus Doudnabacteria bacterium]